ncbi:uncharacterized protein LOC116208804 [Punica granatum]|uniref:Uncharacterized protein LOC116208804 n=1 Tax=Punica granatum TaxID=22663 RepID=A0A6P8DQA2_PUNGR|nr:uncharacterized protein LOC116208804 [Punica granatum]
MLEEAPHIRNGVQLSIVQGYLSKFYRGYGTWVARNPTLVLFASLSAVLVLCLGLIRFKVETRPEKASSMKNFLNNQRATNVPLLLLKNQLLPPFSIQEITLF